MPPPDAVTVKVAGPVLALDAATSRRLLLCVPEPATLEGEKLAVTPEGNPLTENTTPEVNPFRPVTVSTTLAVNPCVRFADVAFCLSVKLGGGFTASVRDTVLVTPPPVAVKVTICVAAGAAGSALSVTTLVPAPGAGIGFTDHPAETPLGNPLAVSAIGKLNPPETLMFKFTTELAP
jgi:hypothetical protein